VSVLSQLIRKSLSLGASPNPVKVAFIVVVTPMPPEFGLIEPSVQLAVANAFALARMRISANNAVLFII
jgi:hypothetical protein